MSDTALLQEIVERLARIEAVLNPQRAWYAQLFPLLAPIVGNTSFTVSEVFEHARLTSRSALAVALDSLGLNARKLGKAFERVNGEVIEGRSINVIGHSNDGRVLMLKTHRLVALTRSRVNTARIKSKST
jgi:hypothetical protein